MAAGYRRRPPSRAFLGDHGWTYDVFLLHAGENKVFVEDLYWALCAKNMLPFFDTRSLSLGDNADEMMEDALVNSSRFIVPIMSHQLKDKPWPEDEMKKALSRHERKRKVVIPVFYNINPDKCGESRNSYFKKVSRITGVEKEERERDDQFIERLTLSLEELVQETLQKETHRGPIRREQDDLRDDIVRDSERTEVGHPDITPVCGQGNSSPGSGDGHSGQLEVEEAETDADMFHPLAENQQQQLQQAQSKHVESVVRLFSKQAVEKHLAANQKRIEEINRRTEALRRTGHQSQSQSFSSPGHQPPFSNPGHKSSIPGGCPEGTSRSFLAAGVEYVVQGSNNQVNVHHHYHGTGRQADET